LEPVPAYMPQIRRKKRAVHTYMPLLRCFLRPVNVYRPLLRRKNRMYTFTCPAKRRFLIHVNVYTPLLRGKKRDVSPAAIFVDDLSARQWLQGTLEWFWNPQKISLVGFVIEDRSPLVIRMNNHIGLLEFLVQLLTADLTSKCVLNHCDRNTNQITDRVILNRE
jgi:hypothetical protein